MVSRAAVSLSGKIAARGAGELDPFQHAVMNKTVMHDQVFGPKQIADRGHVGCVPADEDYAILDLVERRQGLLELALDGTLPATRRLAEAEVPYRSIAAVAALLTRGCPARPR